MIAYHALRFHRTGRMASIPLMFIHHHGYAASLLLMQISAGVRDAGKAWEGGQCLDCRPAAAQTHI